MANESVNSTVATKEGLFSVLDLVSDLARGPVAGGTSGLEISNAGQYGAFDASRRAWIASAGRTVTLRTNWFDTCTSTCTFCGPPTEMQALMRRKLGFE